MSAGEQPSVIEQEQARQALQVLRGVYPLVRRALQHFKHWRKVRESVFT